MLNSSQAFEMPIIPPEKYLKHLLPKCWSNGVGKGFYYTAQCQEYEKEAEQFLVDGNNSYQICRRKKKKKKFFSLSCATRVEFLITNYIQILSAISRANVIEFLTTFADSLFSIC